jgi:hypothetical protein
VKRREQAVYQQGQALQGVLVGAKDGLFERNIHHKLRMWIIAE